MNPSETRPPLIAHIIYALGTGGLENGLINIINRSPPSRYRHVIICLTTAEQFASRLSASDVEIVELHKKPGHDPRMYWRLLRELRRLKPAIVHTRNLAALETQVLGLLMPGCKRVHGEHGRDMHDLDGSNRKYNLMRRGLNPLIHHFIAVSQDLSRWLQETVRIPKDKVLQIYNGVDTKRFAKKNTQSHHSPPGMPPGFVGGDGKILLGTVGRLTPVKDQQLLLLALHRLVKERSQLRASLRLLIIGDGPERDKLAAMIKRLSLTDLVWLAGDREDIPELLRTLQIFALPSLGEGISNTLLEAMASGLPVIATAVGGTPELIRDGDTGLLFPAGDADALVRALVKLIDNPHLRHDMGEAAESFIRRNFDWQCTVDSYFSVYDELLSTKAVHSRARGH